MKDTISAYGSYMGGKAAKAQAYSEAALAERQAQDVDLQALQTSEARRADLRSAISTIQARRAASNVGLDSPSAIAIENAMRRQSQRAESIDQVGFGNQRTALKTTALMKRRYGKSAAALGLLGAGTNLAEGGEKVAKAIAGGGG